MSSGVVAPPGLRTHRAAVAAIFFLVGVLAGTWYARVPELRTALGLDFAQLGAVLLAQTVGVLIAMQLAGHLSPHLDSGAMIRMTAVVYPWFPAVVAVMSGPVTAAAGMLAWGLVAGLLDVAMNAQGVELERRGRRPFLSGLHAMWGVGALLGALAAVGAIQAGASLSAHFVVVACVLSALALVAGRHTLRADVRRTRERRARAGLRTGWTRVVLVLGSLGAAIAICEGAVSGWCGVFLREHRGAAADVAALGYFAFVMAQTGTRLFGDRLHRALGPAALIRWSMAVTVVGVLVAVLSRDPWGSLAGFALQGCGLAVVIPIIAGAVGHSATGDTGLAIARYSTLHQAGVLAGPPLFGWLAQTFGIGAALASLVVPLAVIATMARTTAHARMS